ncbi:uncharacterized protein BYT42DRAFT_559442 [Radiomyces spectabilis]|uniref:uncharacterized protein n=1 Tax=Radiomyces spectabilis TaxID=64574 RepID=UPI00221ED592|nr:uncharacterized protein BYT42DRAFT_559442 [Radiomyces spectabilis]KAI8388242.1 hypothetical protein BYT42DRAFT_559442 [Radiomyces spectabilis]
MTPKRSSCIFDSLPTLDSWYDKEPIPTPSRSCATSRKSMPKRTKCGQNVSFSCDPPSVCYLEGDCDYTDKESHDVRKIWKRYIGRFSRRPSAAV